MLPFFLFWMSCVEEESIEAESLYGSWKNSIYSEFLDLDRVEVYYFDNTGKYIKYTGFNVAGGSNFLGYTMYLEGNYVLSGKQILLKEEKRLVHLGEEAYDQLEGLSEVAKIDEIPASLAFKDDRSVLEITTTCSPLLSSICIPVTTYTRLKTIVHF